MEKIDLLLLLDYFNTHPLSPRKYSGLCFVLLGLWVEKIDNYCYKTYFMTARVIPLACSISALVYVL